MAISKKDVDYLAHLARIELGAVEIELFALELQQILAHSVNNPARLIDLGRMHYRSAHARQLEELAARQSGERVGRDRIARTTERRTP